MLTFFTSFYFFSLIWLVNFLKVYAGFNIILAGLAIFILSIYLSLFPSSAFLFSLTFPEKFFIYIFPLFFWIFEYLRGILFTGFPWNPILLPMANIPFLVQGLSVFGSYGFSGVVLFFFLGLSNQIIEKKINLFWIFFFIGLNIFNFLWFSHKIREDRLKICTVQVQIDELQRFIYGEDYEGLRKGLIQSWKIKDDTDLIVFPESLFITTYEKDNSVYRDLNILSRGFPTLFNANIDELDKTYNSAVLLFNEKILKIYKKIHLVPFGEYIPLRNFFEKIGFKKIARSMLDFERGKEPGIFYLPEVFGVSICYEIIFPEIVRDEIREGAKFLVVLTNDSWYGKSLGPYQHFLLAQIKAVEFHRPLVRSALTGISGFVDSHGRTLSKLGLSEEGVLCSKIEPSIVLTPYFYFKEYPPFIIILFVLIFTIIKKISKK